MFLMSAPRSNAHAPGPSPMRRAQRACAGLLIGALIVTVGAFPASAAPETPAPTPASGPTVAATAQAAPSTPQPAPTQGGGPPSAEPGAAPAATPQATGAAAPVNPGAFMGQGASRAQRGISPNAPVPALLSAVEAAQPFDTRALPSGVQGMDVSGWQAAYPTYAVSQVNWAKQWSMGSRFVYVKATEGDYFVDASRTSHLRGATAVGMLRGAYHFALPNQSSAVAQADFFLKNGGSWKADGNTLPPLLDMENNPYTNPKQTPYYGNNCYNMTPAAMVAWIKAFSNRVLAQTGRLPAIYTNYYWWQACTGDSKEFAKQPLHVAAYGAPSPWVPGGWKSYQFWQYSDTGPFDGDSNVWNGTLAGLKAFAKAADAPLPAPSITSPADVVAADGTGQLWNYPNTSAGSYGPRKLIGKGWSGLRSINVIDWDADGTLDIVAQWTSGRLSVYRGLPAGGFAAALTLAPSGWGTSQLTLGYWLNSSSRPQILATSPDGTLRLWQTAEAGKISGGTAIGSGFGPLNLTMVDFDGDGKQDLLAQDPAGALRVYRSNGTGGFINEGRKIVGAGWSGFTSVTVSSGFTGPGTVGLLARSKTGILYYYPVLGNSRFGTAVAVGRGFTPFLIAGGEPINQTPPAVTPPVTAKPTPVPPKPAPSIQAVSDVVSVDGSGTLRRYPTGASTLGEATQIGAGFSGTKSFHVTDWNADGVLDLLVQWQNGTLTLYKGAPSGGFTAVVLASSGWAAVDLTVGQWAKGSKHPSILARHESGNLLSYTTTDGASLTAGTTVATGLTRVHPVMIDFDGDGNADILAFDNIGRISLLRSTGKGTLIPEGRPVVGTGWGTMTSISPARGYSANGSSGLLARTAAGALLHYPIAKSRFGQAVQLAMGWGGFSISGSSALAGAQSVTSTADVVTADAAGVLWNHRASGTGILDAPYPIGIGWKGLKTLTVVDWNSDGVPDVLAQWSSGAMSLYPGTKGAGFGAAVALAASGWAGITFTPGAWTGNATHPGLVGTNAAGDLFHWPNNSGKALGAAQKIGIGWGTLKITMVDFDLDGRTDILAMDPSGTMHLYRTNGAGAFIQEARATVGKGWGAFTQFDGSANFTGKGSQGVLAHSSDGRVWYYPIRSGSTWGPAAALANPVKGLVISR